MEKRKYGQSGFAVLEIILLVVIVGLIAGVGWYVYQSQHKTSNTLNGISSSQSNPAKVAKTTTSTAPNPDLSTYSDKYVSFQYPKTWTVIMRYDFSDPYGAYSLDITAPVDPAVIAAKAGNSTPTNLHLSGNIIIAKKGRFTGGCAGCGAVVSVEKVTFLGRDAYLLVSISGTDKPAAIALMGDPVKVGDKSYGANVDRTQGVALGNFEVRVGADYQDSNGVGLIGLNAASDFTNSKQYTQFKELIKTITVKTSALPQ